MEPIKLEFIVKGDIEKELAKVKLAIKGVGDESYTSFSRLLSSSNDAFNSMSKDAQRHALILQRYIQKLRQNEAAQEALYDKFKKGSIASNEYVQAQSRLAVQQAELKQRATDVSRTLEREIQLNKAVKGSIEEKKIALKLLREEYSRLNKEERENEKIGGQLLSRIKELERETKSLSNGLKEVKASSSDLTDSLEQIPGPIGDGVSQFKQLLSAGKAFMSSGIGIFVGGLTVLFYGLKTAIEGSEQATTKMKSISVYFQSIWATQKKMLTEGAASIYNIFTGDWDAAEKSLLRFRELQLNQVNYGRASALASEEQVKINKQIERNNGLILANSAAIEQYRTQLMDVNKTFEERKKIGEEVLKLEKENANLKLEPLAQNYDNFMRGDRDAFKLISGQFSDQIQLANKYFKTLTEGGELTLGQQHDLINAVNDITSGLDRVWDDKQKAKFRSYFTEALDVTKNYYNRTREVSTNLSNIIKQQANETAKANKKTALEKLQEEVKLYKEQYAILYAYERNMGKEAADEAFKDLKAKGDDYMSYLTNKINELQNKPNRTKDENMMLGWLQQTRQEAAPKFDASAFRNSIEEKKKLYQEDIDAYIAYLEKLRRLMSKDTTDAGIQKRIILDLEIKGGKEEQQKQLDDLVKNYQTFTLKMSSLEKSYQQDIAHLGKAYHNATTQADKERYGEALEARTNAYQLELASLTAENSEFTQVLFGDMEKISRSALRKAIAEAKKFIEEWKKTLDTSSPEVKAFIERLEQAISSAEKDSSNMPDDLRAVANALQDCANMAEVFDSDLANVLQNVADLANAAAEVAGGIAQISAGNVIQGIASIVSGVANYITSIGKRIQENKKIREEYLQSLVETYSKELEYNSILRERLRIQQQIGETTLEYSERLDKELKLQQSSIDREYSQVWNKLMGEKYISGQGYKHGTWFRKAKTWNEYSSLAGKSYEDIESLYTQDKLEGAAKTLFERLKALKDEGADVVDMMDQLNEEMKENWTGTTSSAISDSIVQGFIDGKKGAIDFADDFKGLMRDAMMKSIQMKYLEAPLRKWYEKFAEGSESGLTDDKINKLREQYNAIITDAAKHAEEMEKVTGITVADPNSKNNENTLKGALAKASQESIDLLAGQAGALRVTADNTYYKITSLYSLQERGWNEVTEIKKTVALIEGHAKRTSDAVDHMSTVGVKINMNMN